MTEPKLYLRPILFLLSVFTLNVVARMLLSPLLLPIEEHYGLSHAEGGALFLVISIGYSVSVFFSGFVARWLLHRGTIVASGAVVAAGLLVLASAPPLPAFYVGLALVGVGTGLYGPSGIAMLTGAAHARHWGKAVAVHEIGPIVGFFAAPVLASLAIRFASWQLLFGAIAAACLAAAVLFARLAHGGRERGTPPSPRNILRIWSIGRFWIVALFFVFAIGLEIGVYSMLPTFLVEEHGMTQGFTNTLVGISRLSALALIFTSGWLADRIGAKRMIGLVSLAAGAATVGIGAGGGALLVAAVLLQPMLIAAFFPAGVTELAKIAPPESRNLAISLVIPVGNLFGAGAVPAALGYFAERGHFGAGFVAVGGLMLTALALLPLLPATRREPAVPGEE